MNKTKDNWLSKPRSGRKLSAILWIATFIFSCLMSISILFFNFYIITEKMDAQKELKSTEVNLLDTEIFKSWVEFIEIWVYGLCWFSGFIAFGSTAKNFVELPQKAADDLLKKIKGNNENEEKTVL